MLVRPLFITSFMLADFLQDNAFFGARQLLISSASSKTAYGTAFCLAEERAMELLALTSVRNRGFVERRRRDQHPAPQRSYTIKTVPPQSSRRFASALGRKRRMGA